MNKLINIRAINWYVNFLEKDKRSIADWLIHYFLWILSLVYGLVVTVKNFLYDANIIKPFKANNVISIGNISWAGSGKTTLAMQLYGQLSQDLKVAVLRRGYGADEGKLLDDNNIKVFSNSNRISLVNNLAQRFNCFILDDGFQYRKLSRNVDIVVMAAREFKGDFNLIPASFFRESLSCLNRADIVVINYADELSDCEKIISMIRKRFPNILIYLSKYELDKFVNLDSQEIPLVYFQGRKFAAISAIGYPQGFFNKLRKLSINVDREIVYPDHYEFTKNEFQNIEKELISNGIKDIIITAKDRYHLPENLETKLNIGIMKIKLAIENSDDFYSNVRKIFFAKQDKS